MANDFNMTNNTSNNRWDLTYTVDASGTKTKTLETAGTFVDRNIQVSITTNSGTVTPAINNTNLTTYFNTGTSSNYSISLQPTYTNTAGYIAAHTGTAGNGTTSYYSIKTTTRTAGAGSVTLTAGNGNVTLSVGAGDSGSSSATSMSMATTTPTSGVYYTLTATGKGTVTGTGKGTVSTGTGWITSGSTTSSASASSSKDSNTATTYGYITKSVHGDAVTGSTPDSLTRTSGTYLDIEIQPNGYLKIPAGYYPLDRYVFSNKADISGEATAASNYSLNVSSISGSSDVLVGTLASGKYPIIANNVSVTGTLTAGTAGWFSSGEATDSDTDNVTVGKMNAAAITTSSSNATATTTVAPGDVTIAANTTSVSGKTRVAITPTTATTGISTYYIAVKANAAANSTGTTSSISGTATASVSTAGYAPTTLTGSGNVSGIATAKTSSKDSSVYYLPLPTAAGAWSAGTTVAAKATPGITNTDNIATITSISGKTAGTDYWTLTPTISSSTAGTYTAKYTYNSNGQGWVPSSQALTDSARSVTVSAQSGTAIYIPKATYGGNNGNITVLTAGYLPQGESIASMDTVTPAFDGGALNSKGASATFSNITTSTTDNGILIQTKGTAGRDAVLYNGAVAGYVSVADNTTASAAVASSTWDGTKYYVTGITVPKDKAFTLTTTADTALDTTSNITITNNAYRQVNITNSGSTTVTSGSKIAGNLTVAAYDTSSSSSTTNKTIVTNGVWTTTAANAAGTYYGRITVSAGSHSATSASSSNSTVTPSVALDSTATSTYGFTTTKPSGTTGTNYITVDPNATATAWSVTPRSTATAGYVAAGNVDGTAVSNTPTIAAGTNYYVPIVTPSFTAGSWTTNTNTNTVSTIPVVTLSSSGTFKTTTGYGVTTTKPSGTDGTNYLTIDGSGSVTTTGVATSSWKATYSKSTYTNSAGLITAHTTTDAITAHSREGTQTVNITPTVTDNFAPLYIPIVSASFSGGGLTPTNYSGTPTITLATGSSTNMINITVGAQNTSTYPYYFKVNASTAALSGTTTVTRAAMTYTNGAGAIAAHNGTQALASGSSSPTVTVNAASNSTYVSLKKATMTVAGTNTVTPTASATGSQATLVSTNNSGISITATGGGTASVTATATTNAAGYAPASTQLGSATLTASSNTTTDVKYLKEVKIVPPSSGTREFGIVVPNGSTTDFITFVFHVDSSGNVTVDNEYGLTY